MSRLPHLKLLEPGILELQLSDAEHPYLDIEGVPELERLAR